MWPNSLETVDLVTFTEEFQNENFIFSVVFHNNVSLKYLRTVAYA